MADEEATQAPQEDKAPQEDVKPDIKPEPSHLTLTVVHQDGSRVPFKVKKTTVFDKLFRAYCQKKSLDQTTLVFMDAEGRRVLPHQTPADFDMEDGDTIERPTQEVSHTKELRQSGRADDMQYIFAAGAQEALQQCMQVHQNP